MEDPLAIPPCEVLRSEHQIILRVVNVLRRLVDRARRGAGFERAAFLRCGEFMRLFADACHHAKEEELLFPVLEGRGIPRDGGPIGVMLYEHRLARDYTKEMIAALDQYERSEPGAQDRCLRAAQGYIDLLTAHIDKEDNILFCMGDRVMSHADQATLSGQFCEVGCRTFGGKRKEELARIADELEAQWGHG